MINTTRTKGTEQEYRERAINLSIKAYKEAKSGGVDVSKMTVTLIKNEEEALGLHIVATARWARAKWVRNVNPKTWRKYRCSFRFYANELLNNGVISSSMVDAVEEAMEGKSQINQKGVKKTSAKKKKHFNDGDFQKIIERLISSRAINAKPLSTWLYSNQMVGLRPVEWKTVKVIEREKGYALEVKNAKNTNNRSHGEHRIIPINSFTEKQQKTILSFANLCIQHNKNNTFEKFYEDCRKLLQRTCKKVWPNRVQQITLYTTRHQFSANLKQSGRSLVEIAYLMGHISTDTAMSHYGKKRYGKSKVTPEVDPKLVTGIKKKFTRFTFKKKVNP